MTNNQIVAVGNNELSQQEVQTLRQTIASELNDSQFNLFLAMCQKTGANPIVNEIHPSVFKGQMTVQFGYDFYIRKAKETEGYQGFDVQLIHENDEFQLTRKHDEQGRSYLDIAKHDIGFPRGKVIGGYAVAYREGVPPLVVPMEVEEVEHLKKSNIGMQRTMWNNYFSDMFKKHILKRALKMQFGLEFDENPIATSSGEVPEYDKQRQRKDITPSQDVIEPAEQKKNQTVPAEDDEETKLKKAREEMKKKFKQLGITDKAEMTQYIQEHCEIKGDKPTLAELTGLLKIMDMHIEEMNENQSDDDLLE